MRSPFVQLVLFAAGFSFSGFPEPYGQQHSAQQAESQKHQRHDIGVEHAEVRPVEEIHRQQQGVGLAAGPTVPEENPVQSPEKQPQSQAGPEAGCRGPELAVDWQVPQAAQPALG